MNKKYKTGLFISFIIFVLAIWLSMPLSKKLNLGLDLKGGLDIVIAVDVNQLKEAELGRIVKNLKTEFVKNTISDIKVDVKKEKSEIVLGISKLNEKQRRLLESILDKYSSLKLDGDILKDKQLVLKHDFKANAQRAIDRALLVIRNRIDQFGVAEPVIKKIEGQNRIQIQLPGTTNPEKAKELIKKTGFLKFNLVKRVVDSPLAPYDKDTEILLKEIRRDPNNPNRKTTIYYVLEKEPALTGDYLADARQGFGGITGSQSMVFLTFTPAGAKKFEEVTSKNVGKQLAIVLDDKVQSAPRIKQAISGGEAVIEGSFTLDEAKYLAMVLRSGSLPAPVKIMESRTVGPTLGAESIRRGVISILAGFILVMVYMLIYYRFLGVISVVVLLFNLVLVVAGLSLLGATLTLPGFAGIILTIGMSVDANVIIFERIKEELRIGKTLRASIDAGFNKAFWTIFDANLTTLLTAFVLYVMGTGPIKGFAVTLTLGIVSSMFTALYFAHNLINAIVNVRNLKTLKV
jgi:preprotein translocase subunit SecD